MSPDMPSQPAREGREDREMSARVDALHRAGFPLCNARLDDPCAACGCPQGAHRAVLPAGVAAKDLLDRIGPLCCPACERACGTWQVHVPDWL
jgi:hypothetical protein